MENRSDLLRDWYAGKNDALNCILAMSDSSERRAMCVANGVDHTIVRTLKDYSRYAEASLIRDTLAERGVVLRGLRVLDFGCLVSDYGVYFARLGAKIRIYDRPAITEFAQRRFEREALPVERYDVPTAYECLFRRQELVIFGEVLEHLQDPLETISACIVSRVRYIFTSCYPFGDPSYFRLPGHTTGARDQQADFLRLIQTSYVEVVSYRKARVWKARADNW